MNGRVIIVKTLSGKWVAYDHVENCLVEIPNIRNVIESDLRSPVFTEAADKFDKFYRTVKDIPNASDEVEVILIENGVIILKPFYNHSFLYQTREDGWVAKGIAKESNPLISETWF